MDPGMIVGSGQACSAITHDGDCADKLKPLSSRHHGFAYGLKMAFA
jgi:hypothetical protein